MGISPIDAKPCCTSVAPILQTFMEAQWLRVFSLVKYHMIAHSKETLIESVLLTKVHVESQIVCYKMHQRGNVKNGNNYGHRQKG